ncbi:MAG: HAD-IIA family hydrolase [Natronomonas sp.]
MQYDGAVIDLDGTVYRGGELIDGATTAIDRLRGDGISVLFFSNNPIRSRQEYANHLSEFGIRTDRHSVLSAGTVTTQFLRENHADDALFVIGDPGLHRQFDAAGLTQTTDPGSADVLVVSYNAEFDYDDMVDGYRALAAGARFYGTDPDLLVPEREGMKPGSGAVIRAVGGVLDREPDAILGKPSAAARDAAFGTLSTDPERSFVVGDRLNTDIALGELAGATTILVRTGVDGDRTPTDPEYSPDHVVDSIADVPDVVGL